MPAWHLGPLPPCETYRVPPGFPASSAGAPQTAALPPAARPAPSEIVVPPRREPLPVDPPPAACARVVPAWSVAVAAATSLAHPRHAPAVRAASPLALPTCPTSSPPREGSQSLSGALARSASTPLSVAPSGRCRRALASAASDPADHPAETAPPPPQSAHWVPTFDRSASEAEESLVDRPARQWPLRLGLQSRCFRRKEAAKASAAGSGRGSSPARSAPTHAARDLTRAARPPRTPLLALGLRPAHSDEAEAARPCAGSIGSDCPGTDRRWPAPAPTSPQSPS